MNVRFWGVRGSIPVPGPLTERYGGNTSCVEVVTSSGTRLVFDAGTGLRNLGRALMERAIALAKERGADGMDLNTAVTDTAARGLYETLGFTNQEGPGGPSMLFYELNWS